MNSHGCSRIVIGTMDRMNIIFHPHDPEGCRTPASLFCMVSPPSFVSSQTTYSIKSIKADICILISARHDLNKILIVRIKFPLFQRGLGDLSFQISNKFNTCSFADTHKSRILIIPQSLSPLIPCQLLPYFLPKSHKVLFVYIIRRRQSKQSLFTFAAPSSPFSD